MQFSPRVIARHEAIYMLYRAVMQVRLPALCFRLPAPKGRYLRPGLSAHTAQALATASPEPIARPVSAPIPNAFLVRKSVRCFLLSDFTDFPTSGLLLSRGEIVRNIQSPVPGKSEIEHPNSEITPYNIVKKC